MCHNRELEVTLVLYYMKVLLMPCYTSQSAWARNDSILKLLYGTKAEAGGKKSLCTT